MATGRAGPGRPTSPASSPAPSTGSRSARRRRPVADGPVCAAGHELGRQRHRVRPGRLRLGRRRLPDADLGRPRHLRDARRDVRGVGRPARHLRRRPPAAAATCASSGSSPSRSCRRSSSRATSRGATTRPTCSPSSPATAGRTRSSGSSRGARARHRGHRRRRLQPPRPVRPRPVAVRRLGRGRRRRHLLLQRRARRHALGRDPPRLRPRRGPHVPARQRADLAGGVPLRRPAVRLDGLHPDRRRRPERPGSAPCPTAGRSWPGSTTRSARASRGRSRSPRTSRTTRSLVDADRRGRGGVRRAVGRRVHPPGPARARGRRRRRARHGRGRRRRSSARVAATR